MRGSERGRWKSTHLGNSLAAYCTSRRRALEFNVDVICRHPTTLHAPHIGQPKTRLQHVLTATAVNLVRLDDWWAEKPQAKTRCSHFTALAQAA
jgi:hypothetical protein